MTSLPDDSPAGWPAHLVGVSVSDGSLTILAERVSPHEWGTDGRMRTSEKSPELIFGKLGKHHQSWRVSFIIHHHSSSSSSSPSSSSSIIIISSSISSIISSITSKWEDFFQHHQSCVSNRKSQRLFSHMFHSSGKMAVATLLPFHVTMATF